MLNRVSAALAQFIKPIASSRTADRQPRGQSGGGFKKFDSKQEAQVIPLSPRKAEEGSVPEQTAPPEPAPTASVASSFIQLMEYFRERRGSLFQKRGMSAYRDSEAAKKGRYRKGAVVDQKIGA